MYKVLGSHLYAPRSDPGKAAELLDLPFSTYRRYRDRGVETIIEWLWDRDVDHAVRG